MTMTPDDPRPIVHYYVPVPPPPPPKSRGVYAVLCLFLGATGAHRLYARDFSLGPVMLGLWLIAWPLLLAYGLGFFIWLALLAWSLVDLVRADQVLYADRSANPMSKPGWGEGWQR